MTDFVFTSPEGQKYRVTGPEGATQEEAFAILQGQLAGGSESPQERRSTSLEGLGSEAGKGSARGAIGTADFLVQGALNTPPGRYATAAANVLAPDITRRVGESVKEFRDRLLSQVQASKNASIPEQMLGTGTELATSAALTGGLSGGVRQAAMNTLVPAVGGAVGEQAFGEQGKAVGALAAPFVASRVGAALSPQISDGMRMLIQHGAEPTSGQIVGGGLKRAETLPGASLFTEGARTNAAETLTTAAANRALSPLGLGPQPLGKINPKEMSGFDIYAKAENIASKAYEDILPQLNISLSGNAGVAFSKAASDLKAMMPKAGVTQLNDVLKNLQKPGTTAITGEDMKLVDKGLGQIRRDYLGDPAVTSQQIGQKLTEFQGALRDLVAQQNPQFAIPLQRANAAWNNLVRVQLAVTKAGANDGFFTPSQLQSAVKQMETYAGSFAKGEGVMQDFSNAAVKELGSVRTNVPYSMLNQGLRSGAGAVGIGGAGAAGGAMLGAGIPAMATGAGAALAGAAGLYGAAYTPTMQGVLRSFLTGNRPAAMGTLGDLLRETRTNPAFVTGLPQFQSLQGE